MAGWWSVSSNRLLLCIHNEVRVLVELSMLQVVFQNATYDYCFCLCIHKYNGAMIFYHMLQRDFPMLLLILDAWDKYA
jgi:hypothetical protein